MKHKMARLLVIFAFGACAVRAAYPSQQVQQGLQQPDKRVDELQKERDKLKREKDPVGHTKIDIRISEILLGFIGDSAKNGDFDQMQKQLQEYSAVIDDAADTMMKTGRDANRHPGGFKDLEISLRHQMSRLEGLGQGLTFEHRDPVIKAKEIASGIRDRLIKALLIEDIRAQNDKS